jgi:hypothetical protein
VGPDHGIDHRDNESKNSPQEPGQVEKSFDHSYQFSFEVAALGVSVASLLGSARMVT